MLFIPSRAMWCHVCLCGRRQLAAKLSEFPTKFLLPLSARMSCSGLVVEKCRVMDSKQVCCSRLATDMLIKLPVSFII